MASVNLIDNPNDFRAVLLGSMGFSNDYIQRQTGLSTGQVQYRLRKGGIRLGDYRDGTNAASRQVLVGSKDEIGKKLRDDLEKLEQAINSTFGKTKARSKKAPPKKTRKVA